LREADCIFKKVSLWMRSLARREYFCFQIKSRTSQQTWNRHRALKWCAIYCPPVMYRVFDNSGNHSFNGLEFQTHWTDTITLPPKFGPLSQNNFWYCPNFVCHFSLHFLRIEILELPVIKKSWTYWHLTVRIKFSFMYKGRTENHEQQFFVK